MVSRVPRVEDFSPQDEVDALGLPVSCRVLTLRKQKLEEVVSCSQRSRLPLIVLVSQVRNWSNICPLGLYEGTHLCTRGKCVFFVHDASLGTGLGRAGLFRISG